MKPALSRNNQTYIAMVVIYNELLDFSYGEGKINRDARDLIASFCNCDFKDAPKYIFDVVSFSINNFGKISNVFIPHLKNWEWKRLPLLTQSILLISYSHYQIEKVDKKVVINCAVDLAKKYIDEKQSKFINAILDEVL